MLRDRKTGPESTLIRVLPAPGALAELDLPKNPMIFQEIIFS